MQSSNLSLLFLQCPVPAWLDLGHEQPPSPVSMALGAAHTPTSCNEAEHTHTAPRTSIGPHTLAPWSILHRPHRPIKWHAREHYALNGMQLLISYLIIFTRIASLCHALFFALTLAERSLFPLLYHLCLFLFLQLFNHHFLHFSVGFVPSLSIN